jgi:hypothetical protein
MRRQIETHKPLCKLHIMVMERTCGRDLGYVAFVSCYNTMGALPLLSPSNFNFFIFWQFIECFLYPVHQCILYPSSSHENPVPLSLYLLMKT